MQLNRYKKTLNQNASLAKMVLWTVLGYFFSSWIPGSFWRIIILRLFNAKIGYGCVIKPRVRIKFPWKLTVGHNSWIGEGVWIDNLCNVDIGDNTCISQGVYFCTGSHDWEKPTFDLIIKPIKIASQVWLCAMSKVGPGVEIGEGSVLCFGSIATQSLGSWTINKGDPARTIKKRVQFLHHRIS